MLMMKRDGEGCGLEEQEPHGVGEHACQRQAARPGRGGDWVGDMKIEHTSSVPGMRQRADGSGEGRRSLEMRASRS